MGLTTRAFYNQVFALPGVLQGGILTTSGLSTRGSFNEWFLQPRVL